MMQKPGQGHVARAHRFGRSPINGEVEVEERGLLGGIVGGIIHGVDSIINHLTHHQTATAQPATTKKATQATYTRKTTTKATQQQTPVQNTNTPEDSPVVHKTTPTPTPTPTIIPEPKTSSTSSPTPTPDLTSSSISSLDVQTSSTTSSDSVPSSTPSPTSTDTPGLSGASSNGGGGLSTAGLGVLITFIILIVLAVAFFLGRRYQRKRRAQRNPASAWAAANLPTTQEKKPLQADLFSNSDTMMTRDFDERSYATAADIGHRNNASTPFVSAAALAAATSAGTAAASTSNAADTRQKSAFSDFGRSPPKSPGSTLPSPLTTPFHTFQDIPDTPMPQPPPLVYRSSESSQSHFQSQATDAMEAMVAISFIPTLPDELHIEAGDRIRVLQEFDDGWALCQNAQGDEGMIPVECISRNPADGSWRAAERSSSIGH